VEEAKQRRPAVPWALALLAGIALGRNEGELPSLLGLGVCVIASGLSRGGERFRRLGGLAVVCAIGAGLVNQADFATRARVSGWLPEDGRAIECAVVGRVLDVPAPGDDGEVDLFLAARPEAEPGRATIRLAPA
jgi:hypothetical protein